MEFRKINKTSCSVDIYNQIKDKIKNGEWVEGSKIPSEAELCKIFGVSRVSIRSAINQLKGQSLIETYQGKGSFVADDARKLLSETFDTKIYIEKEDYLDIIAFRSALELASIDLIVQRACKEDYDEIESSLKLMEASANDCDEYTDADYKFHYSIIKASRNKIFIAIMEQNKKLFIDYLKFQNIRSISSNFRYSLENHRSIYAAIKSGDVSLAKELLTKSFERNTKRLFENSQTS